MVELAQLIRSSKEIEAEIEIVREHLKYGDFQRFTKPGPIPKPVVSNDPIEQFITEHRSHLQQVDIEFLRLREATTSQVADYLKDNYYFPIASDTVCKKIGNGYRPGLNNNPRKGGRRTVETISAVEKHVIYQEAGK